MNRTVLGLSRASTSLLHLCKIGVDGRDKPGHDGNRGNYHRASPIARSTASLGQQSTLSPADFW